MLVSLAGRMDLAVVSTYAASWDSDGDVVLCSGSSVPPSDTGDPVDGASPCSACGIAPINCDNWLCAPPAALTTPPSSPAPPAALVLDGGSPNGVTAAAT